MLETKLRTFTYLYNNIEAFFICMRKKNIPINWKDLITLISFHKYVKGLYYISLYIIYRYILICKKEIKYKDKEIKELAVSDQRSLNY